MVKGVVEVGVFGEVMLNREHFFFWDPLLPRILGTPR